MPDSMDGCTDLAASRVRYAVRRAMGLWWLLGVLGLPLSPVVGQEAQVNGVVVSGTVSGAPPRTDVVVYLESDSRGRPAQPIPGLIDQRNLEFLPRLQVVAPGTAVEFVNSDPILHNVFSPGRGGGGFDLGTYPRDESRSHVFIEPGTYAIMCHVHPEMIAYVLVIPSTHHAVVEEGQFVIGDVPPGPYTIYVWRRGVERYEEAVVVPLEGLSLDLWLPRK